MAGTAAEVAGSRGPQTGTRRPRAPKENGGPQQAAPQARFFLAKPGTTGTTPALERECATEAEAIAEAFKTGSATTRSTSTALSSIAAANNPFLRRRQLRGIPDLFRLHLNRG